MRKLFYRMQWAIAMLILCVSATAQQSDSKLEAFKQQDPAKLVSDEANYTLPWDTIKEQNIQWKKRVWRTVDATDPKNEAFVPGPQNLASILATGAVNGRLKAYDAMNDRFTKELSPDAVRILTDLQHGGSDPTKVSKYLIKEDWLFLAREHKIVVRIIGLAPVVPVADASGNTSQHALFWIYYPDSRTFLATHKARTDKTWDELMEGRSYGSTINKVSDNMGAPKEVH